MKANELRIGNLLLHNGKIVVVEGIGDETDTYIESFIIWHDSRGDKISEFSEIPLTPEILEKCGFIFNKEDDSYWTKKDFGIRLIDGCLHIIGYNRKHTIIKYLHELQNAFHALAGEELEIKEK